MSLRSIIQKNTRPLTQKEQVKVKGGTTETIIISDTILV